MLRIGAGLCALALVASGCATPRATGPGEGASDAQADAEVVGAGLVIDDGDGPELCLGPVALSDPPQCAGIALRGWSWDAVDDETTRAGTTWGSWAVPGRWDGESLTVGGAPVPLALYDTTPAPWPEGSGPLSDAEAGRIGAELAGRWDGFLQAGPRDGRVDAVVVFDAGELQRDADARYGAGAVVVTSALRPLVEG